MKKIGIFEESEYGLRLYGYLNRNLSGDIQIYRFSQVESYCTSTEKMDLYLMSHTFYDKMRQVDTWKKDENTENTDNTEKNTVRDEIVTENGDKIEESAEIFDRLIAEEDIIFLTDHYEEGAHCRWDHPRKLTERIKSRLYPITAMEEESQDTDQEGKHRIIAVYSPFPMSLSTWILPRMKPGSLYLGFEDIGENHRERWEKWEENDENYGRKSNGEFCYYVRLREEEIFQRIEKESVLMDGRYVLHTSEWFFDFVGLREEDFQWLISKLKDSDFQEIYFGIGNSVLPSLGFFEMFDQVMLLDLPQEKMIHEFCERLSKELCKQGIKSSEEILRIPYESPYESLHESSYESSYDRKENEETKKNFWGRFS